MALATARTKCELIKGANRSQNPLNNNVLKSIPRIPRIVNARYKKHKV